MTRTAASSAAVGPFTDEVYELRAHTRRLAGPPEVLRIACHEGVRGRWYWRPYHLRLIFLIEGRLTLRRQRERWRMRAPSMVVQPPGEALIRSGAALRRELVVVYPRELWAAWRERGLFAADTPAYRIADAPLFHALLGDLVRRLPGVDEPWEVERVDRLCELLAFTAATNLAPQRVPRRRDPLATIRHELQRRAFERIDVEALAVAQGMSPSTFRRRWRSRYGLSPMGFVQQARMAEACRLLVETSEPVARIAARVGYDDPLYFSRVFRKAVGVPPSEHRRQR